MPFDHGLRLNNRQRIRQGEADRGQHKSIGRWS
jgi:hypothetical protein